MTDKCRLTHNGKEYARMVICKKIFKVRGQVVFVNISPIFLPYLTIKLQLSQPQSMNSYLTV